MSLDFLNKAIGTLDSPDFGAMEDIIWQAGADTDGVLSRIAQQLLSEVRHVRKEYERYQNDPNYNYSGRIHRNAILSRNNQIAALEKQIKELKATTSVVGKDKEVLQFIRDRLVNVHNEKANVDYILALTRIIGD